MTRTVGQTTGDVDVRFTPAGTPPPVRRRRSRGSGTVPHRALLDEIVSGAIEVPEAQTFELTDVRDACKFLEEEHYQGKVGLLPQEEL